jgi:hypothetical protein
VVVVVVVVVVGQGWWDAQLTAGQAECQAGLPRWPTQLPSKAPLARPPAGVATLTRTPTLAAAPGSGRSRCHQNPRRSAAAGVAPVECSGRAGIGNANQRARLRRGRIMQAGPATSHAPSAAAARPTWFIEVARPSRPGCRPCAAPSPSIHARLLWEAPCGAGARPGRRARIEPAPCSC